MYNGNKHVAYNAFSRADFGIIARIGKETWVRLKLPKF